LGFGFGGMSGRSVNILWIVTTQWRGQACGFAGDVNARTPWLDRFAAQSVNYTQAVTPHPFGPFARAALLTGVPSPENGVAGYYDALPLGARTIAHALGGGAELGGDWATGESGRERGSVPAASGAGYHTAFFGKWHLAERDRAAPLVGEAHARMVVPKERRGGFVFWEGFESGFLLNDPWLHGSRLPEPQRFAGYQSAVLCERAAAYLETLTAREPGRPWFAVVSLEAPHPPYGAAANGVVPVPPEEVVLAANVPRGGEVEERARRELAGYYAHIAATDAAIGRLVDALPNGGQDVAVVFTSVHGDMHGAHGLFRKGWPREECVRVPLLVRHPHEVARREDDVAVSLLDLPGMTRCWARGELWTERPQRAEISMPCVVALPDQCDYAWSGWWEPGRGIVIERRGPRVRA